MGLLDRFESGTERVFTAPFARLFKREELQPVEIGAAIRKAMDSRAAVVNRHRTIVPNVFTIELADDDFDRLISFDEAITDELIADAQEYVTQQRYTPGGPLQIELVADPDLQPGIYKLHHATVRNPATLDERGDIDSWGANHERFDDAIDRHTSGHRIPADAKYLGEVDEAVIAAAQPVTPSSDAGEQPLSRREERRREKELAREEARNTKEQQRADRQAQKEAERAEREAQQQAERQRAQQAEVERRQRAEQQAERQRLADEAAQDARRSEDEAALAEQQRLQAEEDQALAARDQQDEEERQRLAEEARRDREREAAAEQHREEIRRAERERQEAQQADAERQRAAAASATVVAGSAAPAGAAASTTAQPATRSTRSIERPWVEIDGTRHTLTSETTLVGRDATCDITIADPGISRRHVELRTESTNGRVVVSIRDLGSTNGTFVGGEQIRNARLADGDSFMMGRTTVKVRLGRAQ